MEKKEIITLFRQYYGRMYGMAVSILYDEQESKDVVSDIFERLLVSDTLLLPDTVEHYLLTSVRNSCLKRIAQKSNRQRIAQHYASEQQLSDSPRKGWAAVGTDELLFSQADDDGDGKALWVSDEMILLKRAFAYDVAKRKADEVIRTVSSEVDN